MPCRHAVLCNECAETLLSSSRPTCPICRDSIRAHARGSFAEDYVAIVEAMEARIEQAGASAYEGMYNRIRPLMVTGAILGTGAAACFVPAGPAAIGAGLAAGAFTVRYGPWFAT